jgi:hypothetical protein
MTPSLHICESCHEPFVVPVSLLHVTGGRYVVELGCNNCGRVSIGVHEEPELEALDRELDRTVAAMVATAHALQFGVFR